MKTLVTADLHLSETIWSSRPDVSGDAHFALTEVTRVARSHHVEQVVLAGDVFDSHQPTSADVLAFWHFAQSLQDHGILLWYVEGQHDRSSRRSTTSLAPPWCSVHPHARHAAGASFDVGGLAATGLDWTHGDDLPGALVALPPDARVLVCHQAWKELLPLGARADGSLDLVPPWMARVFTGDRHRSTTLVLPSGVKVWSPGATHLRRRDEPDTHCVLVVTDDGRVESVPLRGRPIVRFLASTVSDLVTIDSYLTTIEPARDLPAEVARPLVLLEHARLLGADVLALSRPEKYHLSTSLLPDGDTTVPRPAPFDDGEDDKGDDVVLDAIRRRASGDGALETLARELWESSDPRAIIDRLVATASSEGPSSCV